MFNLAGTNRALYILVGIGLTFALWSPLGQVTRVLLSSRNQSFLSNDARWEVLRLALELGFRNPLSGVGYRHFADFSYATLGVALNTHNDYVRIAAESGLVALAFLIMLIVRVYTFVDDTVEYRAIRAVLLAALVSSLFTNAMTDLRVSLPLWLFLGFAWAGLRQDAPDVEPARTRGSTTRHVRIP
jgi:O-antigen ligase